MIQMKKKTMQELSSHNLNWLYISDHSYRLLIIGGLGSGKANALLNLITTSQILIKYAKDPYEAKYQFLINKRESTGSKHFNDPKSFIEYSNYMQIISKILKNTMRIKNVKY